MKVLILSINYSPEPIGIAPVVTDLAEGLVARGHDVRVVTAMPNYPEREIYQEYRGRFVQTERINGVTVCRHWLYTKPRPGLVARILMDFTSLLGTLMFGFHHSKGVDTILCVSPALPTAISGFLIKLVRRAYLVLNVQDLVPDAAVAVGLLRNKTLIRVFSLLERFAYRVSDKIVVISDGFRRNLLSKGVPTAKLEEIWNWVDTDFVRELPRETALRQEWGLEEKFVVLYSGNIALTQGLETVVEAARLLKDRTDIHVVVLGNGPGRAHLEQMAEKGNLSNITFGPLVPRERLPELLATADVSLVVQKRGILDINLPSKSTVIMASGRPMVAAVHPDGSMAHMARESGGAMLVTPEVPEELAEAIRLLADNPVLRAELGTKARLYSLAKLSKGAAVSRYAKVLAPKQV